MCIKLEKNFRSTEFIFSIIVSFLIVFTLIIDFSVCSQMERVDIQSIFCQFFTVKSWVEVESSFPQHNGVDLREERMGN